MQGVKIYLKSQICFRKISNAHFTEKSPHGDIVMHPVDSDNFLDIIRDFKKIEKDIEGKLQGKK
jgi:hypothetical protein